MQFEKEVVAAFVGALAAGGLAWFAGWNAFRLEVRRRDHEWARDMLFELYSNCIYYLVKLSISSQSETARDRHSEAHVVPL